MVAPRLYWFPTIPDWRRRVTDFYRAGRKDWDSLVALAKMPLDYSATSFLDDVLRRTFPEPPSDIAVPAARLALLGSSTLTHLQASIRVAGLRRGMHFTIYENEYGQYMQETLDKSSALHKFAPTVALLALDAAHVVANLGAFRERQLDDAATYARNNVAMVWGLLKQSFKCQVIQQTPISVFPAVLGSNEHRLTRSGESLIREFNLALRQLADLENVDILAIDNYAARYGLESLHDTALWHRAKQEVALPAAPLYGDLVARIVAAAQGRSAKCLVVDLDNTIWGGIVGDDGIAGIVLGQGSAEGEAYVSIQEYLRELRGRGILLAVCSKNDATNALEPFEHHPEMVLRRNDFVSFAANWDSKAENIRAIAAELNIGLDSMVSVDDS